jgi:hypothetical protein
LGDIGDGEIKIRAVPRLDYQKGNPGYMKKRNRVLPPAGFKVGLVPRLDEVTLFKDGYYSWQEKVFSPAGYIEKHFGPGQLVAYTPSNEEIARFVKLEERHASKREMVEEDVYDRSSSSGAGRPKKCGKALSKD